MIARKLPGAAPAQEGVPPRVVVTVAGGIAHLAEKPAGVEVVFLDIGDESDEGVAVDRVEAEVQEELDELTALVLEAGGLPNQGTELARRLGKLARQNPGEELADVIAARHCCPKCRSSNLRYGRDLTGCSDCGWHETA